MQITVTGEIADHVRALAKKDTKLAQALAQQFLAAADPAALGNYLIGYGMTLLAARLATEPEAILRELQQLTARRATAAPARGHGRAETPTTKPRGRHKRHRLGIEQAEKIKAGVRAFLGKHGAASRKALTKAIHFPSTALYNRIIGEMKKSGEVVQKGEKSKTVYSPKGKVSAAKKAKPVKGRAKNTKPVKAASKKAKKTTKKRATCLCPVPGCQNKAAPVFGMMCRDHKDVPKAEQKRLFAERRAAAQSDQ